MYRNPEKIPQNEHIIVQEYIDKPFLVDGFKCDMRIYVLVTSCDPLRIFLYNDGLLRMGTEHYVHPSDHNIVSSGMCGWHKGGGGGGRGQYHLREKKIYVFYDMCNNIVLIKYCEFSTGYNL